MEMMENQHLVNPDIDELEWGEESSIPEAEIFKLMLDAYQKTKNPKYVNPLEYFQAKYENYPQDPVALNDGFLMKPILAMLESAHFR
jgi:hypothetical protein